MPLDSFSKQICLRRIWIFKQNSLHNILLLYPALILLTCIGLHNKAIAQAPYFLQDGTRWVYYTQESSEPNMTLLHYIQEEDLIQGDTIINSKAYKKLYIRREITEHIIPLSTYSTYFSILDPLYLRHDTILRKMFLFSDTSAAEIVLWDFGQSIGDTVPMLPANGIGGNWVIDSIEPFILFGVQTNKYYLRDVYSPPGTFYYDDYIIEGLGGSNGLSFFQPVEAVVSGGIYMTRILCFQLGDSVTPTGPSCPFFTGIQGETPDIIPAKIYPNPSSSGFFIQRSRENTSPGTFLKIYDLSGREVYRKTLSQNPEYINFHEAEGFFIWQLQNSERVISQGKLIIKD